MRRLIYLDYNATTPVDPGVLDKMLPYFSERFGNPDSKEHAFGWDASAAVEEAREFVAELINARPSEIIFTTGATEGINLALRAFVTREVKRSIITCSTEHTAVLDTCRLIERIPDCSVIRLSTDRCGQIDRQSFKKILDQSTMLALMMANNETGVIHSMQNAAAYAHSVGAPVFSDLTQAVGKIRLNMKKEGIDIAAFSSHKIYGPKAVGALYIRDAESGLKPLIMKYAKENGTGTLNVPGIVGFGEACRLAHLEMGEEMVRIGRLRDKLEQTIVAKLPDVWINGDKEHRLTNTSNIGFAGVEARALIRDMHDIAVSTRSACSSNQQGPSHVLKAMGLTDDDAYSCIRFSLGRFTTEEEIDHTIEKVSSSVAKLRCKLRATV